MKVIKKNNNLTGAPMPDSTVNHQTKNDKPAQINGDAVLSHTGIEQFLYELVVTETKKAMPEENVFITSDLMILTGVNNYSSLRQTITGLVNKMNTDREKPVGCAKTLAVICLVCSPSEILEYRRKTGSDPLLKDITAGKPERSTSQLIERLVQQHNLSRRQAQVALKCAEGLSNAEIGAKLLIRQETVKFHLRNIFMKFGIKRRTELIAKLFRLELTGLNGRN